MSPATIAILLSTPLPSYALGQPMEDAVLVVPAQSTQERWRLRCAGDPQAPAGLSITYAEQQAGVERCWTMEIGPNGEARAAYPLKGAIQATKELEFLDGRIVRITTVRFYRDGDPAGWRTISKKPREAAVIDALPR